MASHSTDSTISWFFCRLYDYCQYKVVTRCPGHKVWNFIAHVQDTQGVIGPLAEWPHKALIKNYSPLPRISMRTWGPGGTPWNQIQGFGARPSSFKRTISKKKETLKSSHFFHKKQWLLSTFWDPSSLKVDCRAPNLLIWVMGLQPEPWFP